MRGAGRHCCVGGGGTAVAVLGVVTGRPALAMASRMRRELSKDAAALEGSTSELAEIRVDAEQVSRIGTQLKRAAAREQNRRRQSIAELMAAQQVIACPVQFCIAESINGCEFFGISSPL